jgi:molybdopterin converting factor small subunit
MTIHLRIFGDLRKKVQKNSVAGAIPLTLDLDVLEVKNITDILEKFSIEKSETSHIFVNSVYAGFSKKVKDGDRVGIFPKNMSLLYKWYFKRAEDE